MNISTSTLLKIAMLEALPKNGEPKRKYYIRDTTDIITAVFIYKNENHYFILH